MLFFHFTEQVCKTFNNYEQKVLDDKKRQKQRMYAAGMF